MLASSGEITDPCPIGKAARERKKERFTALFHHITVNCSRRRLRAGAERSPQRGIGRDGGRTDEADLEHNIEDCINGPTRSVSGIPSAAYTFQPGRSAAPASRSQLEDKIVNGRWSRC